MVFTVEEAGHDDVFDGETFVPSFDDKTSRFVRITAALADNPDIYDYVGILVLPSMDYFPRIYIADIGERTITLHAENIPDGEHRIFMSIDHNQGWSNHLYLILWTRHLLMDWQIDEMVEFVDGIGVISLDDDDINILEMKEYLINLYWHAWIDELEFTASGLLQVNIDEWARYRVHTIQDVSGYAISICKFWTKVISQTLRFIR